MKVKNRYSVRFFDWAKSDDADYTGWRDSGIYANTVLGKDRDCSIEIMTLEKWWEDNCK